ALMEHTGRDLTRSLNELAIIGLRLAASCNRVSGLSYDHHRQCGLRARLTQKCFSRWRQVAKVSKPPPTSPLRGPGVNGRNGAGSAATTTGMGRPLSLARAAAGRLLRCGLGYELRCG